MSASQFGIDFAYDVGRVTVSVHGELDALSVPAFGAVLRALSERGTRSVTIDLSELRFCNVGGLRALAELAARLQAIDSHLEIVGPAILTRMLEISDLHSLFVIIDSDAQPGTPGAAAATAPVPRSERSARSIRPRTGSHLRLSTGT